VLGQVFIAWLVTVPAAALIGAATYLITAELPPPVAGVCIVIGFLITGWLTIKSMKASPNAEDFEHGDDSVVDLLETLEADDDPEPADRDELAG
jgi:hypothetical protein